MTKCAKCCVRKCTVLRCHECMFYWKGTSGEERERLTVLVISVTTSDDFGFSN